MTPARRHTSDMRATIRTLSVLSLLAIDPSLHLCERLAAQEAAPIFVRVFVDCDGDACDEDHLRREIVYVEWVRDQADADVQVLVTEAATGAGGRRYDLAFTGRRTFEGMGDTLRYTRNPTDTEGEARDGLTRTFAGGLLRYVARTPAVHRLQIAYDEGSEGQGPASMEDPWNRWVFRTSLGGTVAAEDRTDSYSLRASQSVSRVTEGLKIALDVSGEYQESNYETSDTTSVSSLTESYQGEALLVYSLGSHWGIGFRATAERSTFRNYDLAVRLAPAVEFNFFPYEESTRRQLRILYAAGPQRLDYEEETVYFKTLETRYHQSLSVSLDVQEYWGSAIVALEGSQYLDDARRNRLEGYGFLQVRLFRGFGVFVEGSLARIRDQIGLPRGDATEAEVLLRQRELQTNFQLEGRIGFDITFGSVFSDVVNARFGS